MKSKAIPLLITSFVLSAPLARAVDLTWDIDPSAGIFGGPGTWSTSDPNWTVDDGVSNSSWDNLADADDTALFSDGTGTVETSGILKLAALSLTSPATSTIATVATSGYRFNGGTLDFGNQTGLISIIPSSAGLLINQQINSNLTGSGGLNVVSTGVATGQGRLILNGTNTGLTGGISVTAGLIGFTEQSAAGSNTITLNGGGLFGAVNHTGTGSTLITGINQSLNNNITLAANPANILRVWGGRILTLGGVISGPGGFTQGDTGTLLLSGANTYSGPTAAAAGVLIANSLNKVTGGTASSSLGAPLTVADGTIAMSGSGTQANLTYTGSGETTDRVIHFASASGGIITQNGSGPLHFGSNMTGVASAMGVFLTGGGVGSINGITNTNALLNFNKTGTSHWTVNGNLTLNGGNIRPQGGILTFSPTSSTTGNAIISGRATNGILRVSPGASILTATANYNGILGGWAVYGNDTWAVTNGTAVTGLAAGGYTTDTWAPATQTDITPGGADPASDATTHSLRFNTAGAKTLTLAGSNTLTGGGILVTSAVGANPTTITGGNLRTANVPGTTAGAVAADLVFHQMNSAGELVVNSIVTNAAAPAPRTGSATGSTAVITAIGSTADLVVGMSVTGTGVPANATIASINSATQITLSAATTVAGTPVLTFGQASAGLTKAGPGTLILNGANSYRGPTSVSEGKLVANANSGGKIYNVGALGTLEAGFATGVSVYDYGVNVTGSGTAATTGLTLKTGFSYTFQSGLNVLGLPTTIRSSGLGAAVLSGWDSNGTHLLVPATASGTVFDAGINFAPGSYGYVMNISAGNATATGDVTFAGQLTGAVNANGAQFRKAGNGSLLLTGAGTNAAQLAVWAGSVILGGGADRIGPGSAVILGNGTGSGKLILNGQNQTLTNLSAAGTGTANGVVGGAAAPALLTVNYSGAGQTFSGTIGGTGPNENQVALVKAGTGTYTLAGANTYTGGTVITGGVLALGSAAAVGSTGAITLAGGTLQFSPANSTDYTVTGRLKLADDVTSSIDTNGLDLVFANPFTLGTLGTGGIGKTGAGTLTLSSAQSFTGASRVAGGVLVLDYATANSSKLSNTAELTLAGGTLRLSGGSHAEIVGNTVVTGNSSITRTGGTATINLGVVTRTGVATLDIATAGIARIDLSNDATGKLPPWITVAGQPAARDVSGNIVAFSGFVDIARLGGRIPNNPSANVRIVNGGASGDITPLTSGITDISSLVQNANAGPVRVSLSGSDVLRLGMDGSIIVPATSGSLTISGGGLTAGGTMDQDGSIAVDADSPVIFTSGLLDNGIGLLSLSKEGDGPLTLAEGSTYTGGTTLTAGELRVNNELALGTGPLVINGGALDNTSGAPLFINAAIAQTWNSNITYTGSSDLFFEQSEVTLTADRSVTVNNGLLGIGGILRGNFKLTKEGPGTLVIRNRNSTDILANTTTTVNAGILEVLAKSGVDTKYVVNPGAILQLGYATDGGYANTNIKIHGEGVFSNSGLYLKGGASYNGSGTIELLDAPTTIRHYGDGSAAIGMFDINGTGLNVTAAASGSEIDPNIQLISRGYGMSMTVALGGNTGSGDLVLRGALSVGNQGFYKRGTGSVALFAAASASNLAVKIQAGSIITNIENAVGENAVLEISSGAQLVLNGFHQMAATLSGAGRIRNGQAVETNLTIRQLEDKVFTGALGGTGFDDNTFNIVKTGASKLTLAGVNTYTGSTTVAEGTLAFSMASLADGADVLLSSSAFLELNTGTTDVIDELMLDGVPQAAGVYGATGSGAPFERDYIQGNGTLTVTTGPAGGGYGDWETANNIGGAGASADSDGDGVSNGIEFVIGGDPSGPGSDSNGLLPTATVDGTYLNFAFRRTSASSSSAPYAEYGSNLAGWTRAVTGAPGATPVVTVVEPDFYDAGVDRVTVRIPLALAAPGTSLFARLKFVTPLP